MACSEAEGGEMRTRSAGSEVGEDTCNGTSGDNQQLWLLPRGGGGSWVVSLKSGPRLDVDGVRTGGSDARRTLYCGSDDDRSWKLIRRLQAPRSRPEPSTQPARRAGVRVSRPGLAPASAVHTAGPAGRGGPRSVAAVLPASCFLQSFTGTTALTCLIER
ncbi:hypothetical protein [Kitasatospora sp. NPDC091207]|uniref:hypothetical protein n=1 Tax=Kitasatospora sp. NPDC091207 TaxID=3364083 RepID=UPI0037FBA6F0